MITKKIRKNSGRKVPKIVKPITMKYDEIKDNALEPKEYWDDWSDHRDGYRDYETKKKKEKDKKKFPYKRGGKRRCSIKNII